MRAKFLLADSAEVREGLLFILGGGWTDVGPGPQVFAIAGLSMTIQDEDAAPLMLPTPAGDQPFRLGFKFDVGRPPGSTAGRSFNLPVAIPMLPIPWKPGKRYVLEIKIDGAEADRVMFAIRPTPPQPA